VIMGDMSLELPIVPDPLLLPKPAVESAAESSGLYEADFFRWTETMAAALRSGDLSQLDLENLAEEIESLGRSDRRRIESRLTVLLMHLLKWQVQPEMRSGSWRGTIVEQRTRIRKLLQESPSLRSFFESVVDECYGDAVAQAVAETGLPIAMFQIDCIYSIEEILSIEFLPD
jgi:Domain of unknown function DUF29